MLSVAVMTGTTLLGESTKIRIASATPSATAWHVISFLYLRAAQAHSAQLLAEGGGYRGVCGAYMTPGMSRGRLTMCSESL